MPSHATENWLRTQLRLRDARVAELEAALRRAEYFIVGTDYLDGLAVIRKALENAHTKPETFICPRCGQHITDGKPCGCGAR